MGEALMYLPAASATRQRSDVDMSSET
jgi:hypothetical protein